jgi:phage I-like protein
MRNVRVVLCHEDDRPDVVTLAQLCAVQLTGDDAPPEWVMLVPAGKVTARDGREFDNADPQAVVDAFESDPLDLPIDYEHATEVKAPDGEEAPAAGWIKALEVRDGAIWGRIEWTPRGAASLQSREYRYISPALILRKIGKVITNLISAGLTNRPALDMPALARARRSNPELCATWTTAYVNDLPDSAFLYVEPGGKKDSDGKTVPRALRHFPYKDADGKVDLPHLRNAIARIPQSSLSAALKTQLQRKAQRLLKSQNQENMTMDREKLIDLLGLKADATDDDIEAAIQARNDAVAKAEADAAKAVEASAAATARAEQAQAELANARAANPSLDKFVPRADYDVAVARVKTLEADAEQRAKSAHDQAVESAIAAAMQAGKVTPGTKDFYVATCATKEGFEAFKKFLEGAPVIGDPSDLDDRTPPEANAQVTDTALEIARTCGVTKEDYTKALAD